MIICVVCVITTEEVRLDQEEILVVGILVDGVETEKCTVQYVVTVERVVKFLLSQPVANLFIVLTVLKKWAEEEIQIDFKIEGQEEANQGHKITSSLIL